MNNPLIKGLIVAAVVPLALIAVSWVVIPDPSQPETAFPTVTFTPTDISMQRKEGSKKRDSFELWLHHPEGQSYYHRDPEAGPLRELAARVPRQVPLKVVYTPSLEGNVLLSITPTATPDQPALAFQDVMAEYASRRRLVYKVAGLSAVFGPLILLLLWRLDVAARRRNASRTR